jgi:hypothetical protein
MHSFKKTREVLTYVSVTVNIKPRMDTNEMQAYKE